MTVEDAGFKRLTGWRYSDEAATRQDYPFTRCSLARSCVKPELVLTWQSGGFSALLNDFVIIKRGGNNGPKWKRLNCQREDYVKEGATI